MIGTVALLRQSAGTLYPIGTHCVFVVCVFFPFLAHHAALNARLSPDTVDSSICTISTDRLHTHIVVKNKKTKNIGQVKFAENGTFKLNVFLYGEKEHDQKLTFYSRALCG